MDTRIKILSLDAARRLAPPPVLAAGYFDVLRAAHVRELAELRRRFPGSPLVAAVLPLAGALLDQRARAELAAALRVVDYVVIPERPDVYTLAETLQPAFIARMEAADASRARQLTEHVLRRQNR